MSEDSTNESVNEEAQQPQCPEGETYCVGCQACHPGGRTQEEYDALPDEAKQFYAAIRFLRRYAELRQAANIPPSNGYLN